MYLFFDTETTGLPRRWNAPLTDLDNWPRLVQLAWILSDKDGRTLESENLIVKPEDFVIPYEASRVHGITTERAQREGVLLEEVMGRFRSSLDEASYLIGHNVSFDEMIVGAEFLRLGAGDPLGGKARICTMRSSAEYCGILGRDGYPKWPNLSELHKTLFDESFDGAHNAMNDVFATARCFWELRGRGVL